MDNVEISFTRKELELLETLIVDYAESLDNNDPNTLGKLLIATDCSSKIRKATKTPCPLASHCQSRTAICLVREPDDGCYYYRYFKDLIKRREGE